MCVKKTWFTESIVKTTHDLEIIKSQNFQKSWLVLTSDSVTLVTSDPT